MGLGLLNHIISAPVVANVTFRWQSVVHVVVWRMRMIDRLCWLWYQKSNLCFSKSNKKAVKFFIGSKCNKSGNRPKSQVASKLDKFRTYEQIVDEKDSGFFQKDHTIPRYLTVRTNIVFILTLSISTVSKKLYLCGALI